MWRNDNSRQSAGRQPAVRGKTDGRQEKSAIAGEDDVSKLIDDHEIMLFDDYEMFLFDYDLDFLMQ